MSHEPDPLCEVVDGWTGPLGPFTIRLDGTPVVLSGLTITLRLRRSSGEVVNTMGLIAPLNQGTNPGQLMYTPAEGEFVWESTMHTSHQRYQLHWELVDGSGARVFAPSDEAAVIVVHRA